MIFDQVKDLVSMPEAVRFYGYDPNRAGFICCPFHNEKTASMKIYARDFHCYGCHVGGDVIDFVGRLFNLDPLAAAKRINEDLKLGLDLDRPPDAEQLRQHRKIQEARQRFNAWREQLLNQLDRAIRIANLAGYPSAPEEILALQFRETMEAWAEDLMHGSMDEQMKIFRDREEVKRLCRKILNDMQTKSTAA